jgi:GNAT superfamily N-acetyltransferase
MVSRTSRYGRGMIIELRHASADDWQVWRAVRLAALADAPGAFGSRLDEWADAPEDRWRNRLTIPGAIDLLAVDVDSGTAVGMATGTPATDSCGRAELISMWVHPSARGNGVASALISAIARWAAENGSTTLALSVMNDNLAARQAYEQNGFVLLRKPGDGVPGSQRELVMLLDLSSEASRTPDSR